MLNNNSIHLIVARHIQYHASRFSILRLHRWLDGLIWRESAVFVATYCYWIQGNKNRFFFSFSLAQIQLLLKHCILQSIKLDTFHPSLNKTFGLFLLFQVLIFSTTFCYFELNQSLTFNEVILFNQFFSSSSNKWIYLNVFFNAFTLFFIQCFEREIY